MHDVLYQVEAEFILQPHFKDGCDALFLVPADVQVAVVAAVGAIATQ
jgi:hypothetical protein